MWIHKGLNRQPKSIWRITVSHWSEQPPHKPAGRSPECINIHLFLHSFKKLNMCSLSYVNCWDEPLICYLNFSPNPSCCVTLQSGPNPVRSPILHYKPNSLNRGISAMCPVFCSALPSTSVSSNIHLSTSRCPATSNTNSNRHEVVLQTNLSLHSSMVREVFFPLSRTYWFHIHISNALTQNPVLALKHALLALTCPALQLQVFSSLLLVAHETSALGFFFFKISRPIECQGGRLSVSWSVMKCQAHRQEAVVILKQWRVEVHEPG